MAGKKGQVPWNKGKTGVQVAWNKGIKTGSNTAHSKRLLEKYSKGWSPRKGKKHTEETKAQMSSDRIGHTNNTGRTHFKDGDNTGKENSKWKGDDVGYSALHDWVAKRKGKKPCVCSICGFADPYKGHFHWANISREYKRDLDDFTCLCVPCHVKYDRHDLNISNAIVKVR